MKYKEKICHWENSIYHKNTCDFKTFFKDQSYTDILQTQTSILNSACIYLFKVNNRDTRIIGEICSTWTIKISELHQWRRSGVFIVKREQTSYIVLFLSWLWASKCRLGRAFQTNTTITKHLMISVGSNSILL